MLIPENLDNESFSDIVKKAVRKISKIYPEWNNHNRSDSGIAILELLSWFKEIQQYHLNVIGEEQLRRYLKLLGKYPENTKPAQTILKITSSEYIPSGTVFYADDIPFETKGGFNCLDNEILLLHSYGQTIKDYIKSSENSGGNTVFYPFGAVEEPQNMFAVYFKYAIPKNSIVNLYFYIRENRKYDDKSLENFSGFIKYHAEIFDGTKWNKTEIINDDTYCFFRSGIISLKTETECSSDSNGYPLRFVCDSGEFVVMPVITSVTLNTVKAFQTLTHSKIKCCKSDKNGRFPIDKDRPDEYRITEIYGIDGEKRILLNNAPENCGFAEIEIIEYEKNFSEKRIAGKAHGLCDFVLKYEMKYAMSDSIEIYIKESNGCFYRWNRVRDFDKSDKYSRHFIFDEYEGEFIFGNGEKGMPPEGEIYVMSCICCMGSMGNVKSGMIDSVSSTIKAESSNIFPAFGGQNKETIDECYERTLKEISEPKRCVTFEDYENEVKNTPGVYAKRVKAFANEQKGSNEIVIAIETCGSNDYINKSSLENLKRRILPCSVIGTKVTFIPAEYAALQIYIELTVKPHYADSRRLTEKYLYEYFNSERIGFGSTISRNSVIDYIYGLAWTSMVKELDISVIGNNAEVTVNGDIKLKNHCLPKIENMTITINTDGQI